MWTPSLSRSRPLGELEITGFQGGGDGERRCWFARAFLFLDLAKKRGRAFFVSSIPFSRLSLTIFPTPHHTHNTDGVPLTAAELGYQSSFNAANQPDVPTWDATTATLAGQGPDTNGETGWFKPTRPVASLTMTSTLISGFPTYQVYMAGFAC